MKNASELKIGNNPTQLGGRASCLGEEKMRY